MTSLIILHCFLELDVKLCELDVKIKKPYFKPPFDEHSPLNAYLSIVKDSVTNLINTTNYHKSNLTTEESQAFKSLSKSRVPTRFSISKSRRKEEFQGENWRFWRRNLRKMKENRGDMSNYFLFFTSKSLKIKEI